MSIELLLIGCVVVTAILFAELAPVSSEAKLSDQYRRKDQKKGLNGRR